jgi:PAS domain-containing protein
MSKPHVSFETQGVRYETHLSDNTRAEDRRSAGEPVDYFTSDGSVDGSVEEGTDGTQRRRRASLSIRMPPSESQASLAFTALQYLPMPVMVLSSTKHIVLANEAIGRLLGIDLDEAEEEEEDKNEPQPEELDAESTADILQGKTLGELGIDLLQGGNAVFVSWEDILQNVVDDAAKAQQAYRKHCGDVAQEKEDDDSITTPMGMDTRKRSTSVASSKHSQSGAPKKTTEVHDAAVDIVFSTIRDPLTGLPKPPSELVSEQQLHANSHMQSKMIISVWATEEEQYFTLTFTAAAEVEEKKGSSFSGSASRSGSTTDISKTTSRLVSRRNAPMNSGFPSTVSSASESSASDPHGRGHRSRSSPAGTPNMPSPIAFPPRGPPDRSTAAAAPSIFTKSNRLKDAILNSMNIPAYGKHITFFQY